MQISIQAPLQAPTQLASSHGGADALGVAAYDFSTNSNACGPCPEALQALQQADPSHYPDPHYTQLRSDLALWHGVAREQIVLGASASELIHRVLLGAQLAGVESVRVPTPAYGDYARQAMALGMALHYRRGLQVLAEPAAGQLQLDWACSPSSPQGWPDALAQHWLHQAGHRPASPDRSLQNSSNPVRALAAGPLWRVLDAAYAPLVLAQQGTAWLRHAKAMQAVCWQLFSPNKSLGLTGVRGAYAIAPQPPQEAAAAQFWHNHLQRLQALAPSWPVGAHGLAMLNAWQRPSVQQWLHASRAQLQVWKYAQIDLLRSLGWQIEAGSQANYWVAKPPWPPCAALQGSAGEPMAQRHRLLAQLRGYGVKLRETDSMGLPGGLRISVQAPAAQQALADAWVAVLRCQTC